MTVIIKFSETVSVCFYSLEPIRIKNPPSGAFEVFTLDYWQPMQLLPYNQIKYGVALPKRLSTFTSNFLYPLMLWSWRLIYFSGSRGLPGPGHGSQFVGHWYRQQYTKMKQLKCYLNRELAKRHKSGALASLLLYIIHFYGISLLICLPQVQKIPIYFQDIKFYHKEQNPLSTCVSARKKDWLEKLKTNVLV